MAPVRKILHKRTRQKRIPVGDPGRVRFLFAPLRQAVVLILAAAAAGACAPAADQAQRRSPTLPPTRSLPSSPAPSPTPALEYEVIDLAVLPAGRNSGRVEVIGLLENRSAFAVEAVELFVTLVDEEGSPAGEARIGLLQPRLAPEEAAAFSAGFEGPGDRLTAQIEVAGYKRSQFDRQLLRAEIAPDAVGWQETPFLLGEVINPGRGHVRIGAISLIARTPQGELIGVSPAVSYPGGLLPGTGAPFVAEVGWQDKPAEIEVQVDAISSEPLTKPEYSFAVPLRLERDDQGNPFLIGVLQNDDKGPRWLSLLATVSRGDSTLAVAGFTSPIPLGPGDLLPFGVSEFTGPGIDLAGSEDAETYEISIFMDPSGWIASPGRLHELQLTIGSIEQIGSSLFIDGEALNAKSVPISQPAVVGALLDERGEVLTAASAEGEGELQPDGVFRFMLRFPLPEGLELNAVEFDLRAFGLET